MKTFLLLLSLIPALSWAASDPIWEKIKAPPIDRLNREIYRTSVPHGWFIFTSIGGYGGPTTALFIPDENHEWLAE